MNCKHSNRNYNFLGEINICLRGPIEMLDLCERNIEEKPSRAQADGEIRIIKGNPVEIIKDKSFPYAWIEKQKDGRLDYFRYGTLTRSYWVDGPNQYSTEYHIKMDCDGVLRCFLKTYFESETSKEKALIHGTLVSIRGKGVLISGPCWSGKTSTGLKILDHFRGSLVSEGMTLVASNKEKGLKGYYLPRPIYTRLATISKLPRLAVLLCERSLWDVEQYFDNDALERIIDARKFNIDAGIRVNRSTFAEIMGISTKITSNIDKLIFTQYVENRPPRIEALSPRQMVNCLRANEFAKQICLENVENQWSEKCPVKSHIDKTWTENLDGVLLQFSGIKDLDRRILEELVR